MTTAPRAPATQVDGDVPAARAAWRWPVRDGWGLALVGGLVIAALAWAVWSIGQVIDGVTRIERERLPKLAATQRLRSEDLEASIALRNALLLRDESLVQTELARFREAEGQAARALADLTSRPHTAAARRLLEDLVDVRHALMVTREGALQALATPDPAQRPVTLTLDLQQRLDVYLPRVDALYEHQARRLDQGMADTLSGTERARVVLALGTLVATAGLLLLLWARLRRARDALAVERQQVAQLQAQRDALVREVHHRIKNHLQGLLAFIDGESATDLAAQGALASMRRHVLTLVGVHGMQSENAGEQVGLSQLLQEQLPLFRAGHPDVKAVWSAEGHAATVPPGHAVPLALVFSELLTNAAKHGSGTVCITMVARPGEVRVTVGNAMAQAQAQAPGQGLSLARALLQGIGRLEAGPDGAGRWTAVLTLADRLPEGESSWPAS